MGRANCAETLPVDGASANDLAHDFGTLLFEDLRAVRYRLALLIIKSTLARR